MTITVPARSGASTRTFADLGVPAPLVSVLAGLGATSPFPIQAATLPDALAGRDVLGRGRTGSGKTLAFGVPLVARLAASAATGRRRSPGRPRGLVLAPTRELANQIRASLDPLANAAGLRTAVVYGGVGQNPQVTALRSGVDIVIACPGRLEDLVRQGHCHLGSVEVTVLDEADHMADLGFLPGVRRLLDATPRGGQRLLFSATLDAGVDVLVRRYLVDPVTHSVDSAAAPPPAMDHHVFTVSAADKPAVVHELAAGRGRAVLFTRTKHTAKRLAKQLTAAGIPAVDLQGNLSQGARERHLAAFSDGSVRALVATDIAARGIHVDDIELVVHVDPPTEHKAYLHRSGRTARAGAAGAVVTVMTPDQRRDVADLTRLAKIRPTTTEVVPGSPAIRALTGDPAPFVPPQATAPAPSARPGGGAGRSGGRGGSRSGSGSASGSRSGARAGAPSGARSGSRTASRAASPAASGAASGAAFSERSGSRAGSGGRGRRGGSGRRPA